MSTTFKTLVGKRVLVNKPEKPESKIQLTPESEAAMEQEMMKQWTALEVYAVGNEVDLCVPGDKVYIETYALQSAGVLILEGKHKLMIAERDIAIVW